MPGPPDWAGGGPPPWVSTDVPRRVSVRVAGLCDAYRGRSGVIEVDEADVVLVDVPPRPFIHPKTGEVAGFEVFVRRFGPDGDQGVDPHRVFINPPDGKFELAGGEIEVDPEWPGDAEFIDDALRRTVRP